jgi:transcriptional antiterminator RfaH
MPLLAAEPSLYPETLFDAIGVNEPEGSCWWALYTMSRREKQLTRLLRAMHVAHYLPTVCKKRRSPSGRIRPAYFALFSNYVFLRGTEEDRHLSLTTNCVSRWFAPPNDAELTEDLRRLRAAIDSGVPLTIEERLEAGDPVRVRSGSFAGYEGTVIRRDNRTRLLVAVRFLQRGVSVLLEDCELEPL